MKKRVFAFVLALMLVASSVTWYQGGDVSAAQTYNPKTSVYGVTAYEHGTTKSISPQKGSRLDLFVTIKETGLTKAQVESAKDGIYAVKRDDSFENIDETDGELSGNIIEAGDEVIFKLKFTNMEYTGTGNMIKFDLIYGLKGVKKISLEKRVPNCVEFNYNDNSGTNVEINVVNPSFPSGIKAGDTINVDFDLISSVKDVTLTNVVMEYTTTEGLESKLYSNKIKMPNFKANGPNKTSMEFDVKRDVSTSMQVLTLNFKYTYKQNGDIKDATSQETIRIPVKGTTDADDKSVPYVVMDDYTYGGTVPYSSDFTADIIFRNASKDYKVENVTITYAMGDGIVSKEASNKGFISKLAPGGSSAQRINMRTKADVTTGYQSVNMTIKYDYIKDGKRMEMETTETMMIATKAKKAKDKDKEQVAKATPYVMVSNYNYGGRVAAGKKFNLSLTIKNTSKNVNMENLVMSLEVAEGLTITSSSNTFYFDRLNSLGTESTTIKMQALPGAKSESTNITVNFKYEYVDKKTRTPVTSTEVIAIPVYQPDRLQMNMTEAPISAMAGEEIPISIQYVNKGKGTASNVSAELTGTGESNEKIQNLGNFEAGASGTIDFYVSGSAPGEIAGDIVISYENDNLEIKKVHMPYAIQITEFVQDPGMNPGMEPGMEEPLPEEKGLSAKAKIGLGVAGGVIVVVAAVIVIKKRKAKKRRLKEELEDMDDDN